MSDLQEALEGRVRGEPFGRTALPRPDAPRLPAVTARKASLRRLAQLIRLLPFERPMTKGGGTERFLVPAKNVFAEQPPADREPDAPTIAFLPGGVAEHVDYGLGPPDVLEGTEDKYGPDTVLVRQSDHVETFVIEVLAVTSSVRDAVVAGLELLFEIQEDSNSLRLLVPENFDQVATFVLKATQTFQDADSARNRRKAQLSVELTASRVALVSAVDFRPKFDVRVERP